DRLCGQARRQPPLPSRRGACLAGQEASSLTLEDAAEVRIVAPRELDDEDPHRAVLGPGRMGDVRGPEDRLAGGDAALLVADLHEAAALDDDEPGRVRVVVRLDPATLPE